MTLNDVLNAVAARVGTLNLSLAGVAVPVVVRKIPTHQAGVDPGTRITVCKSPVAEAIKRIGGIYDLTTWRVRVVVESPNRDDQVKNLDVYSGWRDQLMTAFAQKPTDLMGLDNLQDLRAAPAEFLEAEKIAEGWDHQAVDVLVGIVRART